MDVTDFFSGLFSSTVGCSANILEEIGSLACLLGGLGYAASYLVDEDIIASFLAEVVTRGLITLECSISERNAHQTIHVPANEDLSTQDQWSYNLKQKLNKETLLSVSAIFFGAGTLLKFLGKTLRLWQQGMDDQRHFNKNDEIILSSTSWLEYGFIASEALFESTSLALYSSGIAGTVVNALGLPESSQNLTFPGSGDNIANSNSSYSGPIGQKSLTFQFHKSATIPLSELERSAALKLEIEVFANIHALFNYGAGLLFHSEQKKSNAWPAGIAAGYACGMAASFFNRKQRNKRDERLSQAIKKDYQNVEDIELQEPFNPQAGFH